MWDYNNTPNRKADNSIFLTNRALIGCAHFIHIYQLAIQPKGLQGLLVHFWSYSVFLKMVTTLTNIPVFYELCDLEES